MFYGTIAHLVVNVPDRSESNVSKFSDREPNSHVKLGFASCKTK